MEEHVDATKSLDHLVNDTNSLNMDELGHSEEVETMTIEAMEVDAQVILYNHNNDLNYTFV